MGNLKLDRRAIGVGVALIALAAVIFWDANRMSITSTYGIGPTATPLMLAAFLAALGLGHFVVAFRGGLPEPEDAVDPGAIGWMLGGLAVLIASIGLGGGFIIGVAVLFAFTARAFARRALVVDLLIGFVLGTIIFVGFAKLLSLSLPEGPLERLLT